MLVMYSSGGVFIRHACMVGVIIVVILCTELYLFFFFFKGTAATEIYPPSPPSAGLWLAHHNEAKHNRLCPQMAGAKAIFEAAEQARIEAIGANQLAELQYHPWTWYAVFCLKKKTTRQASNRHILSEHDEDSDMNRQLYSYTHRTTGYS